MGNTEGNKPAGNAYDAMWASIAASPFAGQYLSEVYWLAGGVVRRADALFAATPAPPPGQSYIKVDQNLHADIYALLSDAAKIRALLTARERRKGQSRVAHEIQVRRAASLRHTLHNVSLTEVLSAAVRNTVEHFDEYLDETAIKAYKGQIGRSVHLPFDMVLSDPAAGEVLKGPRSPKPRIFPVRVYEASRRTVVSFGREINIGRLRDECVEIQNALRARVPEADDERGAGVLVITPHSFSRA